MGPEVPPCTQVLPTECKKRSRSLLHQKENTLSGSEVPSLLPFPPSNKCGSQSKSTTKLVHLLSTENASKSLFYTICFIFECQHLAVDLYTVAINKMKILN